MIKQATRRSAVVCVTILAAVLSGCELGGPEGSARVRIQLTDAPSDMIASAQVWISRVYMVPGEDGGEATDLFSDATNPRSYDLMVLRDGITADLTNAAVVDAGDYHQLRIIVDSAFVTLAEGLTFSDGSNTRMLFVPSGAQTGIKVNLAEPIDAEAGTSTTLVVDFDVDQNFVFQGGPAMPGGIQGILFTPVLHEKSRTEEQ